MAAAAAAAAAVGANRCPNAVAWTATGVVAYAAHRAVALWRPDGPDDGGCGRAYGRLVGHSASVTAVAAVDAPGRSVLISGAADHTAVLWAASAAGAYTPVATLRGHTDAVVAVAGLAATEDALWAASASVDGTVRIWRATWAAAGCTVTSVYTIDCGRLPPLAVAWATLPRTGAPVLAVAGVDCRVQLWMPAGEAPDAAWQRVVALKGHEDWVRSVAFERLDDTRLYLASGAQDRKVRLWLIECSTAAEAAAAQEKPAAAAVPNAAELLAQLESAAGAKQRAEFWKAPGSGQTYSVRLDALLAGHADRIYSVAWQPRATPDAPLGVLSASIDKTMCLWRPDADSGLWLPETRVGEMGGQNVLGFYGGVFSPDGRTMLAHGFNGAFHRWTSDGQPGSRWTPAVVCSGHGLPVQDVAWDPTGRFVVSVSADQTTRLWGRWRRDAYEGWHELARPQVHGYDLTCVTFVRPHVFISGADEKVLRVFAAPATLISSFSRIGGAAGLSDEDQRAVRLRGRSLAATTPVLGLSNKAVEAEANPYAVADDEGGGADGAADGLFAPPVPSQLQLEVPPFEDQLMQGTLWAEVEKLYGHPSEIITVAVNRAGTLAASACKASKPEQATIRLWNAEAWTAAGELRAHSLTVTQLAFSDDDRWLLSVSRDRSFCLFERAGQGRYELRVHHTKAHARIIWAGAFAANGAVLLTASRDKVVKVWDIAALVAAATGSPAAASTVAPAAQLCFPHGVNAVDVAPVQTDDGRAVAAAGLEDGSIALLAGDAAASWSVVRTVPARHAAPVTRLRWRPHPTPTQPYAWELASCGEDHAVCILPTPPAL